jgi:hypothetical protein
MRTVLKRKGKSNKNRRTVSKNKNTGVSNLWKKIKSRMTSDEIDEEMRKLRNEWA